jgi:hypothetical protein
MTNWFLSRHTTWPPANPRLITDCITLRRLNHFGIKRTHQEILLKISASFVVTVEVCQLQNIISEAEEETPWKWLTIVRSSFSESFHTLVHWWLPTTDKISSPSSHFTTNRHEGEKKPFFWHFVSPPFALFYSTPNKHHQFIFRINNIHLSNSNAFPLPVSSSACRRRIVCQTLAYIRKWRKTTVADAFSPTAPLSAVRTGPDVCRLVRLHHHHTVTCSVSSLVWLVPQTLLLKSKRDVFHDF